MATVAIDTGEDIVGVLSATDETFAAYRGGDIVSAIKRIRVASEVVTYNGKQADLWDLGRFAGLPGPLPLKGIHTDMRSVIWGDNILGSSLSNTYFMHFTSCRPFPQTYEGACHSDTYKTLKLWQLWRQGKLRVVGGHYR